MILIKKNFKQKRKKMIKAKWQTKIQLQSNKKKYDFV